MTIIYNKQMRFLRAGRSPESKGKKGTVVFPRTLPKP